MVKIFVKIVFFVCGISIVVIGVIMVYILNKSLLVNGFSFNGNSVVFNNV